MRASRHLWTTIPLALSVVLIPLTIAMAFWWTGEDVRSEEHTSELQSH